MSYMLENDPYAFNPEREHNDHVAGMASKTTTTYKITSVLRRDGRNVAGTTRTDTMVAESWPGAHQRFFRSNRANRNRVIDRITRV